MCGGGGEAGAGQANMPHLDSEAPGVFVTAGQQNVVACEVPMQHIKLVQVCQRSCNLLGCQQDTAQVWLSHRGGFEGGRPEPALLNSILQP